MAPKRPVRNNNNSAATTATDAASGSGDAATTKSKETITTKKRKRPTTTTKTKRKTTSKSPNSSSTSRKKTTTTTTNSNKKKRASTTKKAKSSTTASNSNAATGNVASKSSSNPPSNVLIIDNGGDTIKFGWMMDPPHTTTTNDTDSTTTTTSTTSSSPRIIPNQTAKLRYQLTILVGDEISDNNIVQPTQLELTTRSMERSHITNLGNQVQVWKRLLDLMSIRVPLVNTEASETFGWKRNHVTASKRKHHQAVNNNNNNSSNTTTPPTYNPYQLGVLILLAPNAPRCILEQIYKVWFHDFGFGHVGIASGALMSSNAITTPTQTQLIVDMGWSGIHIVPIITTTTTTTSVENATQQQQQTSKIIHEPISQFGIKRFCFGGRHLINLWKYYISYRQWNLMDSEWLIRDVFHQLGYISLDCMGEELQQAKLIPSGKRSYDREFCLPDFVTTFHGQVRLPYALLLRKKQMEEEAAAAAAAATSSVQGDATATTSSSSNNVETEEKKEDNDNDDGDDDEDEKDNNGGDDNDDNDEQEVDSEDETEDERRSRLLKQRQEEERRRLQEEAEQQVLQVSVERFTIPEVLFHPSDAGLARELAGLHQVIADSIQSCPKQYHAALYESIHLVGGLTKLPNVKERLEKELRCLAPMNYKVHIETVGGEEAELSCWKGARKWLLEQQEDALKHHQQWSLSREEWDAAKKDKGKLYKRQFCSNGGMLI